MHPTLCWRTHRPEQALQRLRRRAALHSYHIAFLVRKDSGCQRVAIDSTGHHLRSAITHRANFLLQGTSEGMGGRGMGAISQERALHQLEHSKGE